MNLYICSTPYHIFISLLKMFHNKEQSILLLTTHEESSEKIFRRLKPKLLQIMYIKKVIIRKRSTLREKLFIEKLKDIYDYQKNKKLYSEVRHVFNFAWHPYFLYTISNYIYKKSKKVTLIEDGSQMFHAPTPSTITQLIKKYIYGISIDFYNDKKIENIFVQFPEKYPKHLKSKLELLNINYYKNRLTGDQKNLIISIFLSTKDNNKIKSLNNDDNLVIILTQPLSEDGYITKEEKIEMYRKIVSEYDTSIVVLKRHPREKETYGFDNIIELESSFPSEVFSLFGSKFSKAIGICTSAINYINADEKINLDENFISRRNNKMT